ncbi:MAG: hypothetical protein MUC67_01555 [Acidobacteria bacterium]|jgi:uncharacterized membrane protein|nr:hypothetical protein [Acidobacteriota bacterium]MCU0254437.1 hypothetical protein [Acidobacteriota bacterium]
MTGREQQDADLEGANGASGVARVLRDEDRLMLVFAYLGPLSLIPLFASRESFVRWHARQGTMLGLTLVALIALLTPFHWLFSMIPLLGRMFHAAEIFVFLGFFVVLCFCIERALAGQRYRVPWLADLADED